MYTAKVSELATGKIDLTGYLLFTRFDELCSKAWLRCRTALQVSADRTAYCRCFLLLQALCGRLFMRYDQGRVDIRLPEDAIRVHALFLESGVHLFESK